MHSGVIDTAVQIWHRGDFWHHLCEALAIKRNIYRKNIYRQIVLHFTYNFHTQKMGVNWRKFFCYSRVIDTAVTNIGDYSQFSRRILIHIQKGFNPCRDPGKLFVEKSQRSKISCQGPFEDCVCVATVEITRILQPVPGSINKKGGGRCHHLRNKLWDLLDTFFV
jgi:hypothetical protein